MWYGVIVSIHDVVFAIAYSGSKYIAKKGGGCSRYTSEMSHTVLNRQMKNYILVKLCCQTKTSFSATMQKNSKMKVMK